MNTVQIHKKKKVQKGQIFLNIFFILLCCCYVIPLLLLVSISLEGDTNTYFSLIPKKFTTLGYELVLKNPGNILQAYGVTIFYSVVGVGLSLVVMSMLAYALSRPTFRSRRWINFMLFFTTLFSGGLVPTYILCSSYLHLNDTIWIYILPPMVNAWNVFVIRSYFKSLPQELFEAARLDGASELRICFQIVIPLSTPVLASVGFIRFVDAWNGWQTSQIYIRNPKLYSLQYLLKQILDNAEYLQKMIASGSVSSSLQFQLNNLETMRFAMAIIAVGPALLVFPFFQKYFAKGMVVGSVKG